MGSFALAAVYVLTSVVARVLLTWTLIAIDNPSMGMMWVFNTWMLYVVTVTSGVTYLVSQVWWRGRSVWGTAAVSGLVAATIYLPSVLSWKVGREHAWQTLSFTFVEWFVIGLVAHLAVHTAKRVQVQPTR